MRTKDEKLFDKIERFIDECWERNGAVPTVREIEASIGISKSTVSRYLAVMRDNGRLDYSGHRNIATRKSQKTRETSVRAPVLGTVACGIPKYAEENIEEYVFLPVALFGRGEFYVLHANGDSMVDAGIDDGDLVVIRQQSTAEPGQIVVALVGEEATLKRYYPEPEHRRIRLHPENREFEDIIVEDCLIQGIAVKVMKDLQ